MVSGNFATPAWSSAALGAAREVGRIVALNAQADWPRRTGVHQRDPFVGPGVRDDPTLDYLPMRFSLVPASSTLSVRWTAVLVDTSVPRRGTRCSLGHRGQHPAGGHRAGARRRRPGSWPKMNPNMPFTFGDGEIPVDWIDLAVGKSTHRCAHRSPGRPPTWRPGIGRQVARFAEDGSTTLKLGIGQIPDVAAGTWLHAPATSGDLVRDSATTCSASAGPVPIPPVGPRALVPVRVARARTDWADGNPRLRMTRTEIMNNPGTIASHPAMLSINTALQVDLFAQANASYIDDRRLLRFRRPARLRQRSPPLDRRARRRRPAFLARQDRHLDRSCRSSPARSRRSSTRRS